MRMLIRIVFVIFIANEIDCLGGVCNDCCDCRDCLKKKGYEEIEKQKEEEEGEGGEEKKEEEKEEEEKEEEEKEEYEEIEEDENIKIKSLVNNTWYNAKENKPVLKIFKKKDDNAFPSKDNGDKISIKLKGKDNTKIAYLQKKEDPLKLEDKKYVFFEIKKQEGENTGYLYCSDVESRKNEGIFEGTTHVSISVIACDTEKVTDMSSMFGNCKNLTKLEFGEKFNTTNVNDMAFMFVNCSSLEKLDLKIFNTSNVTDMRYMFCSCSKLTKLNLEIIFGPKLSLATKLLLKLEGIGKLLF